MTDVDHMTRDELRAYARKYKLAGYSKLNRDELRELVRSHAVVLDAAARQSPRPAPEVVQTATERLYSARTAARVRKHGTGHIYPTGGLGTFCTPGNWARHLPGYGEGVAT